MGVHASSRGEVDVAGNGGLSKLEENDTDNLKDDENFRENHGVLSRTTDLTNNQEIVLDIPAPEGEFPGVNDLSIDDGTKTPVSKGGNGETRSDSRKDENVKPWYSCNRVKNQKVVRLSSKNLTDASCSRDVDSSGGRDSSLIPFKEDSQIKDHDIVFEGKSSEQHVSYDACINSHSENVGNPNRVERELETDDVPVSQKRNRKPHSLIKPEEGYDPSWIMTEWVPTKYSCCRKNSLRNASYEDRIIISKASQSLHSHVGEQLNVRDTQEKFLKEKKDDRVDQDNVQYLLSTSDSDVREISTSKDITVAESRKEKMDKSPGEDFLHGVINGVLQNTVKGKRSSTMALPAKESWRRNIVLETGSSKDSADVHTLEEKLRKTSDKILCANNIYTTPKRYRQMPSKKETHARKRKGKTVISEDLSGDFLIKTLISQSRNESSKRIAHSVEFSNPQLLKREILPDEENQIKKRKLFLTKKAPGETGTGKTVIVKTMAPQSRIRLSKREADSQEASNLQQQRSSISSKEENHSKTRIHAPAKKTQKVTSQGKAVIFDNQTEDISIKTLVSQSKEEARSDEVSDPQRTAPKVNPANKCHGEELVGCKIKVWWPMDKLYYDGKVASYDYLKKKHQVDYDDGEKEILDLRSECWEML
ncbi:uncharacterized protein [Henckelia pumila]|uniref:uncharacterized protein n=1 Tax=Henckelia pumila TaxID=405737 RepID=UPI003C6DFD42